MSSFFVELWEGIFIPGPTPTLLKAANLSFGALQFVLFLLLLATYSIHCVILSIICAGLWVSVNWFAAELAAVQREEESKKNKKKKEEEDDGSATEVETVVKSEETKSTAADVGSADVLKRTGGTQSSASTEDEWEKVSEAENGKDK